MTRRRLRLWRLRSLRAARQHYMLAVTAVAIVAAAAAAMGFFDPDERTLAQVEEPASTPVVAAIPSPTPPPSTLTVTYILVDSEEKRDGWDRYEDSAKQRGFLSRQVVEVLVVSNAEQATAASQLIDQQQARYPWNTYVIDDQRGR